MKPNDQNMLSFNLVLLFVSEQEIYEYKSILNVDVFSEIAKLSLQLPLAE